MNSYEYCAKYVPMNIIVMAATKTTIMIHIQAHIGFI